MSNPHTILVVDDDADGRFLVEHRLRRALKGCTVVACASVHEALRLFDGTRIDAIITDHRLGMESGAEFIRKVRRRGITCPILLVTGSDDPEVQREAYAAGATEVFLGGHGDFAHVLARLLITRTTAENGEQAMEPPPGDSPAE